MGIGKISAAKLKQARLNFGITQTQAANAIGVHPKTIAAWEQGDKIPPGPALGLAGRPLRQAYRRFQNEGGRMKHERADDL